ncbi:hypothetical protein [Olsenella urininfantis]|uniref:hypothetical protein n=1 Tax=Olsenella urininfantis TaxID=1871033 RepID=UPI0009848F2D|nr:hypothetical protein [Olsenella urininfantis]
MSSQNASVLVTAAALSVLVIPVITSLVRVVDEADAVGAVLEVTRHEASLQEVVEEHREAYRQREHDFLEQRRRQRREGLQLTSADYLARKGNLRKKGEDGRA